MNAQGKKVKIISDADEAADKENTKNLRRSTESYSKQRPPLATKQSSKDTRPDPKIDKEMALKHEQLVQ